MCYTSKDISPKALNSLNMSRRTYQAASPVWSSSLFNQLPNLPIFSTMICSHSGWPSIHLGCSPKSPTVLLLLFVEQCTKVTNLENPSIVPWITNPQLTWLWWPSKCQRLFGSAAEYARLDTVIAQRILTFWGSTRARYLHTRSRYIINLSDLKWPKTIEEPTKQPCSLRNALTLLSNRSSVTSLKRGRWLRPNSDTLRWIVQRETTNMRAISSQLKPRERSSINVSSFISYFGLPTRPLTTLFGEESDKTATCEHLVRLGNSHLR